MLTDDQKRTQLDISRYLLSRYPCYFIKPVVIQDKHGFTTLTQSQKCRANNVSTLAYPFPKNLRGKVMASIFWDSQRVIMNDYLEHGHTINGAY